MKISALLAAAASFSLLAVPAQATIVVGPETTPKTPFPREITPNMMEDTYEDTRPACQFNTERFVSSQDIQHADAVLGKMRQWFEQRSEIENNILTAYVARADQSESDLPKGLNAMRNFDGKYISGTSQGIAYLKAEPGNIIALMDAVETHVQSLRDMGGLQSQAMVHDFTQAFKKDMEWMNGASGRILAGLIAESKSGCTKPAPELSVF